MTGIRWKVWFVNIMWELESGEKRVNGIQLNKEFNTRNPSNVYEVLQEK